MVFPRRRGRAPNSHPIWNSEHGYYQNKAGERYHGKQRGTQQRRDDIADASPTNAAETISMRDIGEALESLAATPVAGSAAPDNPSERSRPTADPLHQTAQDATAASRQTAGASTLAAMEVAREALEAARAAAAAADIAARLAVAAQNAATAAQSSEAARHSMRTVTVT